MLYNFLKYHIPNRKKDWFLKKKWITRLRIGEIVLFLLSTIIMADCKIIKVKIQENVLNRFTNTEKRERHNLWDWNHFLIKRKCKYLLSFPRWCAICWKCRLVRVNLKNQGFMYVNSWQLVCSWGHTWWKLSHINNTYRNQFYSWNSQNTTHIL